MKILVATGLTQGLEANDYHYCIEGELVWIQEPCERDKRNPDMPCGCGRGFAGQLLPARRASPLATPGCLWITPILVGRVWHTRTHVRLLTFLWVAEGVVRRGRGRSSRSVFGRSDVRSRVR
jgi:hypothetical protein